MKKTSPNCTMPLSTMVVQSAAFILPSGLPNGGTGAPAAVPVSAPTVT